MGNQANLQQQLDRLIQVGVPQLLGRAEAVYRAEMTALWPEAAVATAMGTVVLVENRLSLAQLIALTGVKDCLGGENIREGQASEPRPYWIEVFDPAPFNGLSPAQAEAQFSEQQTGCHLFEVLAYYLQFPEACRDVALDASLSWFKKDYHPTLVGVGAQMEIGAHWHQDVTPQMLTLAKRRLTQ